MSEKTAKLVASNPTISEEILPKEVVKLAEAFKKVMTVSDTGVISLPKETYEQNLPDGLTMEVVKLGQAHDSNVVAALAYATGQVGMPFLKKNTGVAEVNSELQIAKNKAGSTYAAQKVITIPGSKPDDAKVTKFGHSKSYIEVNATGQNRGALKKVRELLAATAEASAKS